MALPEDETTTEQPSIDFEALGLEPVSDEELFGFGLQTEAPETPEAEAPEIDYEALGLEPVSEKELFGFEIPKEEPEPSESFLRPAADPLLNIGASINDVVKGFTDAFGADNPVSQNLAKNSEWYRSLLSAGAKQDQEEIGRIMQEAEGQGVLAEIGAGLKALSVAPVDLVAQGIGSLIPFIATAGVGKAVGLSKGGIAVLQGVQGGVVGGGIVKGEIYSAVKDQLINSGVDEAKAEKAAQEAQAYNGKNLDQILLGVGLGVAASTTGADSAIRSLISRKVGKQTAEQVSEQAVQEVLRTGFVRGAAKDGAVEFATEALQGGQERLAANVAVGREGFDVEPMRGVFGQATLEGALGGLLGGGAGGISAKVEQMDVRQKVALRDAQKAAEEAKQSNAPASAAAVEEQINQTIEETPDEKVARLQREAQEAAGIELEEEPPVSGLPPVEPAAPTSEAPVTPAVAPVEPVAPAEGAVEPAVTEVPAETITQAFAQMGEGAVDSYYQAVLQSLQESGEVPTPERRSNVGQAWERVRGTMTPEEFVVQLRQNAEDPSKIQAPAAVEPTPVTPTPRITLAVTATDVETVDATVSEVRKLGEVNPLNERQIVANGVRVEVERQGPNLNIKDIYSPEQGLGRGTEVLQNILKIADQNEVSVVVTPQPTGTTTEEQLRKWYSDNGFVEHTQGRMIRRPVTPETPRAEENASQKIIRAATASGLIPIKPREEGALRGFYTFQAQEGGPKIAFSSGTTLAEAAPNELTIEAIYTPPQERGTGAASKLLQSVLNISDQEGITLKLEPVAISDLAQEGEQFLTKRQLASWYKRYGFEQAVEGSDELLVRTPKPAAEVTPTPEVREARREPAITPQQDRDYLDAVERGDLDAASRVIDDLVRASGAVPVQGTRVYRGSVAVTGEAGGAGVGSTLGSGVYVTSNREAEDRLAALDYAGGKFTRGADGNIQEFLADLDNAFILDTDKRYDLEDLIADERLKPWFRNRLQSWLDNRWYSNGLTGGNIVALVQGPPKGHGKKADIGKAGFDAVVTFQDGEVYEAAVTNPEILKPVETVLTREGVPQRGVQGRLVQLPSGEIKSADPVTRDDQGNIIPLSQRFQPEQADIRYRRRVQMGRAGMETSAVEARLQELGFPTGGIIRVVNQPDADFEGRTIILDGKVTGIELNAAAMRDNATIDRVLNHEFAESANADGALNRLVERLTPKEKKEINDTITRLRYEERARTSEEAARAIETLAEAWRGRGFFTRAVARVEAWASKLGFKLTRRAAEYIAARNLADINAGFRTAYNQFINVRGEVREGRAEGQAVVDADMGRRSQTELTPQEIDQLEKGEKIRVYRAMQIIDGKLYPPMSALVGGKLRKPTEIGAWEKAEERPDLLDKKGKFVLQKGNKTTVPAAYNPYFHTSSSPLNDQFSSAYKRDNLVTVEVEIPASELTSGYKAEGAKDAVGEVRWNAGPVSSKLPADKKRRVFLSRYAKVVRIVPDSEVAEVISGLLEGTNLSIPENTVTPSLRSELEKRGVAVTPRPARGQEIRESRREPEAIPTFTEGTPEAATLKEMEASMAKVDAASEAKGGKPETYKISEIASVWMDSGLGERELQDAIVEYTNLTPANAAKVAKAIARQYDIQQSIATAFLETQTGLSVEALPEGVTLPKEVDPDRPKPVMQRLFDVFMGVRVPPVKIQVNEKTALKQQIRLKAAANRAAKAEQKRTAEEVVEIIKAMELLGPVRPKQVQALAKRAARVIWTNEKSVEVFSEYAAKVVENANYDADLREAKDAQKRAKQLSTQKKVAMGPQREVLEDIGKIAVNKLDDPRMFAEAVNYYLRGFKSVLSPDYVVIPDAEMESYLSGAQSETQRNQRDLDREANQRLAEKYGIDPDQVNEMMESIDIIKQIEAQENREALENLLTEKAIETQQGLRGYSIDNLRADQRSIVSSMLKVDPKALDPEERQRFIRITNNIIYNNQTNGAEYFVAVAKGQQSAREAAQDSTMVAKNRAWINLLPRFVSERMQRGWALELQSVSDTFRNAFGKGAMAKMYDAMGMLDLNLGFTKANNTIDKIQEQIAEFHRNLEKKYKAAARNQDGLLAEGVVGFLIQSVPKKDEVTSINQRRDLIRQDIANRRRSVTEPDRVAMADRIEAILNRIDGDSVAAILNNMKREFPANHESLVWYKDTLLPQYKDFLKNFDENFNDQANNYENPNYLTIGFTSAGPSLAITPEEQSLFYNQVSLSPKQSAYTIKRVDYTEIPKDPTTKMPKEIEFNLRRNVFNGLSDQINKAYTSSSWQRIASFMKTPEAEVVFGGAANKDFFIERLNRLRLSRMRRGSMGSGGAIERAVDSLSVISRKLGTGIALGGIYQWIKQPPDQLITAWGSGGRADLLSRNIAPSTQKAARELLNKFSIGRRGDASAGYKYINQMEGHQNRLERYFSESKWDQAKEQAGKIADVWMVALKSSDFLAASAAWMTYYEGELNKQDIKIDDWSKEAELIESDPKRRQAAAFAEQMTDIYQGSSDPTSMATFAQSGKTGWENFVKAIFVPFNSFAIQQRMRLYSDARDAINGSKSGAGGLAGTVGGLILFHTTKRYVIPAISGAGIGILYGLMGVDMDEPDEEKQKEEANKNWRQFLADITGNLLVGGTPQIVESQFIDAMNRASYLVSLQLENDSILNDEGEIMSYDQYSKERSPFYRYKSFDNAMSLGMLDIGLGQAEQVALQTKMLATPEEMEMYTPEEQRLLYFSALSEWLYMMRLNDADFARLVGKARRDMMKAAKDREKEIRAIQSGR